MHTNFMKAVRFILKVFIKMEIKMEKIIDILRMGKFNQKVFIKMENLKEKIFHMMKMEIFLKEIFICKGNDTLNWKNCTGVLFANETEQQNCNLNIYMNSIVFMGIKYKDIGFYANPPCEMFVGDWKNSEQYGLGKYMYWNIKDDGYSEIQYFSGTLSETKEKFSKEFRN